MFKTAVAEIGGRVSNLDWVPVESLYGLLDPAGTNLLMPFKIDEKLKSYFKCGY